MNSTQKGSLLLNVSIFNKLSHRTCKRTCLRFQGQRLVGGEGGIHFCYREVCHSNWQAAGVGARRDDKEDKESVLTMRLLNGALCCEGVRSSSSSTACGAARCSHVQHPSQKRRRRGRVTNPFLVVLEDAESQSQCAGGYKSENQNGNPGMLLSCCEVCGLHCTKPRRARVPVFRTTCCILLQRLQMNCPR